MLQANAPGSIKLASPEIYIKDLTSEQNVSFQKLLKRLDEIFQLAQDLNVRVMLDAEQIHLQATLGYLVLLFQAVYNQEKAVVFNTYQCYRKDTFHRVRADYELADKLRFKLAGKFVRGAYMAEERKLAAEGNYEDPINDSYDKTNEMYHAVCEFLLPIVAMGSCSVMVATHNEDTVKYVVQRMLDHGIEKSNDNLCFGQIYGMCDHVSYTLGMLNYQVFKSVPCGSISDTLLYLTRRAHENRSVLQRTYFERQLIGAEIKRRSRDFITK